MKFLHRPVTSFEDISRNFEQLEGQNILDTTSTSFLQLPVAKKLQHQSGSTILTWPGGGILSNATAVTYTTAFASGTTALCFGATLTQDGFAFTTFITAISASQFTIQGGAIGGSPAAGKTATVYWMADGA